MLRRLAGASGNPTVISLACLECRSRSNPRSQASIFQQTATSSSSTSSNLHYVTTHWHLGILADLAVYLWPSPFPQSSEKLTSPDPFVMLTADSEEMDRGTNHRPYNKKANYHQPRERSNLLLVLGYFKFLRCVT